jgi:hypothetical protein
VTDLDPEVAHFLENLAPAKRQRDARTMVDLMARVTGHGPRLTGTMIGFGSYHYRYASGREGDAAAAGFAPRKAALSVYLMDGVDAHADLLARLGPHTTGVGCVYLKDLEQNDLDVLERIIATSYSTLTAGTYRLRAREGARQPTSTP